MLDFIIENRIQFLAILGSAFMLGVIIELIRRKKMKEEYALLWLFSGSIFLILSLWRDGLHTFADLVGIAYPPASLLLILVMGAFGIMVHYSIVISKLSDKNKSLVQELSILKREFEKFSKKD